MGKCGFVVIHNLGIGFALIPFLAEGDEGLVRVLKLDAPAIRPPVPPFLFKVH